MRRSRWTEEHTARLRDRYPVETIEKTAEILGFGCTTIKEKVREYGLSKGMNSDWLDKAAIIRNNFDNHSYSELAEMTGISKTSVARIAAELGLKRTSSDNTGIRSRVRHSMLKREKRRLIFGLDPLTGIKIVTNRKKIRLRAKLKSAGYIVERAANVLYFLSEECRDLKKETAAAKYGLRFAPWPNEKLIIAI